MYMLKVMSSISDVPCICISVNKYELPRFQTTTYQRTGECNPCISLASVSIVLTRFVWILYVYWGQHCSVNGFQLVIITECSKVDTLTSCLCITNNRF